MTDAIAADIFVDTLANMLSAFGVALNKALIFTVLYNLIPALIFGPLLIYKGRCYKDNLLIAIGVALVVVDTHHFIKAFKALPSS